MLRRYVPRTLAYTIVLIAVIAAGRRFLLPLLQELLPDWALTLTAACTLAAMAPFLFALATPVRSPEGFNAPSARVPVIVLSIFRWALALALAAYAASIRASGATVMILVAVAALTVMLVLSHRLRARLDRIERKFSDNLNERELRRSGRNNLVVNDLHQAFMTVGSGCAFVGERLMDSDLRRRFGVNVVSIQRGQHLIPIPNGRTRIFPGDVLGIIGNDEQLAAVLPAVEAERKPDSHPAADVSLCSVILGEASPLIGRTPRQLSLRDRYDAVVVAVHRGDEFIDSNPDLAFAAGDILWFVGDKRKIEKMQ